MKYLHAEEIEVGGRECSPRLQESCLNGHREYRSGRNSAHRLEIPANLTTHEPLCKHSQGMVQGIDRDIDIIAPPLLEPSLVSPVLVIGRSPFAQLI